MKRKTISKKELTARWSKSLVKNFAPAYTVVVNGKYIEYQYDLSDVERVEQLPEFKQELKRIDRQRTIQNMQMPVSYELF